MSESRRFGEGFPPKSIAVVGVSTSKKEHNPTGLVPGMTGLVLFRMLRGSGFKGRIYPVNPKGGTVDGVTVYSSVTSIPEPLDLVTVSVPAAVVPQVLEDCVAAGPANVHIQSSGFGESGEEGRELEGRIKEIALRGGLRVIGPNCMGFHVPSANMRMFEEVPLTQGQVAFVSQSGGHARMFLLHGGTLGFGFSKVISYGNALVLDETDFLEYLADDPETQVICMYLEGVKDGRRLMELVRQLNPVKPVIIMKGGMTAAGARAAASHTGSLAGDRRIWDSFFKQTGAIRAGSLEEMAEATMTILSLKPSPGMRVAVLGIGGGNTVGHGDICIDEGLDVPALSSHTVAGLTEFIALVNQGVSNPLDVPSVVSDVSRLPRTLELIAADPVIDMTIVVTSAESLTRFDNTAKFAECILRFTRESDYDKPVIVAFEEGSLAATEKAVRELRQAGIIVFPSLTRACRALRRFAGYHRDKCLL